MEELESSKETMGGERGGDEDAQGDMDDPRGPIRTMAHYGKVRSGKLMQEETVRRVLVRLSVGNSTAVKGQSI